jgi:pyruvate/oxaloacetate carboxyltransferase
MSVFLQRVDERRVKGEDVVAYALANDKAYKFLTKSEKHSVKERQAALGEVAQQNSKLKQQQELAKIEEGFFEDEDALNT